MTDQLTPTPANVRVPVETTRSNGLAVVGFVLALLGACSSFIPLVNTFGDFLALLGLILGVACLVRSRARGVGRGLPIAAIILALEALVISIMVNAGSAPGGTMPTTAGVRLSADALSSCTVVKDALLNGTPADIHAGMLALIADKTADQTAREYAGYYTGRDKDKTEMLKLGATLIWSSCS